MATLRTKDGQVFSLAFGTGSQRGLGPTPGTTEHAFIMLLLVEVAALVLLRRYFRSAHGG